MKRADLLEMAILGLLGEGELHGYELRKRLTVVLGPLRPLSYGSLYPALHRLTERSLIVEASVRPATSTTAPATSTRRARVQYARTEAGARAFADWANDAGPDAWDDEGFAAHLAFFSRTEQRARLRILEGRRTKLEERLATMRAAMQRMADRIDPYTQQLQQHGVEGVEREVSWLNDLITHEQTAHRSPNSEETR